MIQIMQLIVPFILPASVAIHHLYTRAIKIESKTLVQKCKTTQMFNML